MTSENTEGPLVGGDQRQRLPGVVGARLAALGLALVENGWRVPCARTTDLVQQLQIARRELALESAIAKLDRYDAPHAAIGGGSPDEAGGDDVEFETEAGVATKA
jgi:hypothetical protein